MNREVPLLFSDCVEMALILPQNIWGNVLVDFLQDFLLENVSVTFVLLNQHKEGDIYFGSRLQRVAGHHGEEGIAERLPSVVVGVGCSI